MSNKIEGFLGVTTECRKSRCPAKLDLIQSGTGIFLGLFMWMHMVFVSTILFGQDFYDSVVHILEARFLYDSPAMSCITSFLAACVFLIFFIHAGLGMRKMPINYRQWQAYKAHKDRMQHSDTSLWWIQFITGFIMFFLGSAHLIIIITHSHLITDGGSAARVVGHMMWAFYLVLLFSVELHGSIGLYRVCLKWGIFEGKDAKESRAKLKKVKWFLSVFFIFLGVLSLLAFMKLGFSNDLVFKI